MADQPSSVDPSTLKFLGKEMYLVVTRPVRWPIAKRLADHLAHQVELEKRGVVLAAGPLYPRGSDVPEAGMFVLRASSSRRPTPSPRKIRCTRRACAPTPCKNGA